MDLTPTLAAKSSQVNADDLIGGPLTIRITNISSTGSEQQPVAIEFEGAAGRAFMPCKSMRRVMVAIWGADGKAYVGRSLTLFRDPEVSYGGIKVGGVRISHMSHMDAPMAISLSEKRGKKTLFKVHPLAIESDPVGEARATLIAASQQGTAALTAAWQSLPNPIRAKLKGNWWDDLKAGTVAVSTPQYEITGGVLTFDAPPVAVQTAQQETPSNES